MTFVADVIGTLQSRSYKGPNHEAARDGQIIPATYVKAVRSGARDADGNLPPEVWKPDHTSPTLSAFDNNSETRATVLAINENQRAEIVMTDIAHSITSGGGKPGQGYPAVLAFRMQAFGQYDNDNTASALKQRDYKDATDLITGHTGVRRLTPIECERLMGWPDNWTAHTTTGPQADSHRYRQTGNGVVANVTHWIGTRLHGAAS